MNGTPTAAAAGKIDVSGDVTFIDTIGALAELKDEGGDSQP